MTSENSRLVNRLATMQQEKWRLEERVLHLEETNAAMADEMVNDPQFLTYASVVSYDEGYYGNGYYGGV